MAAELSLAQRLIIQEWTGPIAASDVNDIQDLIGHYGSAYGAALSMLITRRSQMRVTAANRSAGDDRSSHEKNLAEMTHQIGDLVRVMSGLDTFTPTQAELDLMASVPAGGGGRSVDILTSNRRPG